jgi:hypothetical protein
LAALSQAPESFQATTKGFLSDYKESNMIAKQSPENYKGLVSLFLKSLLEAYKKPYPFQPYHKAIREPVDYYSW